MAKRRLIETLEVQIAVPDPGFGVAIENMLAQWGGVRYAELSVLLVQLRFLAVVHQTHHWTAKGDPFYGDHLLYERLYNGVVADVDTLAEKAVGLGGNDNVNLPLQLLQLNQLAQSYGMASTIPQTTDLAKRSMAAEIGFLRCAAHCACSLKEAGLMTRGLDNMLQGIEDKHEGHVYLLKQRSCPGM
jgi:DNA-binding ferritin-like protein